LLTDLVFLVGIGWYFFGILPTNTKGKLGWYILVSKNWREPLFPSKKGGYGPLLEHSAPLLREKGFLVDFFKKKISPETSKNFLPNPTVQKIPTGYTNRLVLVPTGQTASIGIVNNTRKDGVVVVPKRKL
jgi:hypothetical protein